MGQWNHVGGPASGPFAGINCACCAPGARRVGTSTIPLPLEARLLLLKALRRAGIKMPREVRACARPAAHPSPHAPPADAPTAVEQVLRRIFSLGTIERRHRAAHVPASIQPAEQLDDPFAARMARMRVCDDDAAPP